ncbi:uncharacterized protein BDZ83DRAFT_648009 [Colletotrichum acutatum]|uniref:Uncharacterized protein n=1 Tax=Glomerella acutata TaxID=27357 RepID=A0AAD9D001_GLOAC|nr:uncharacterized protein BDZ83DRAFT_648009 [Colletotrichum acutatum]KAK1729369.1 hypothetical protein BDZ83DRAFT_648009 [Colletotrichum acutatum]
MAAYTAAHHQLEDPHPALSVCHGARFGPRAQSRYEWNEEVAKVRKVPRGPLYHIGGTKVNKSTQVHAEVSDHGNWSRAPTSHTPSPLVTSHAFLTTEPNLWPRPGQLRPTTPSSSERLQCATLLSSTASHPNTPNARIAPVTFDSDCPHGKLPCLFNNDRVASSYFSCALHEQESHLVVMLFPGHDHGPSFPRMPTASPFSPAKFLFLEAGAADIGIVPKRLRLPTRSNISYSHSWDGFLTGLTPAEHLRFRAPLFPGFLA